MALSENQKKVVAAMRKYIEVNKDRGFNTVPFKYLYETASPGYYSNGRKHFGELLARMVKQGHIVRDRIGWYKLPEKQVHSEPVQTGLFQQATEASCDGSKTNIYEHDEVGQKGKFKQYPITLEEHLAFYKKTGMFLPQFKRHLPLQAKPIEANPNLPDQWRKFRYDQIQKP